MEIKKPILIKKTLKSMQIEVNSSVIEAEESLLENGSFENKEIEELSLTSVMAEGLLFGGAKLEEVYALDSIFSRCDFSGTVLNRVTLERVEINNSRIQGTQYIDARFKEVTIKNSKGIHSSFRFSKMKNVAFVDCDLGGADFQGSEMENVIFENCNLKDAQFSSTKLIHVNFSSSNIESIKINKESFGKVTVNTSQALYLSSIFGLVLED